MLGIALNALWPLIANADPRPGLPPVVLCSMSGGKLAAQSGDEPGSPYLPATTKPRHCMFCASGGCIAAPASALQTLPPEPATAPQRLVEPDSRLAGRIAFLLAASRAPPLHSFDPK